MDRFEKICQDIKSLFDEIDSAKMRFYGEPWDDWSNHSTGVKNPCVYFLYVTETAEEPISSRNVD